MADLQRLQAAVEAGDRVTAVEITQGAIDEGMEPLDILDSMTEAMAVIGERFSRQEIFVPEMLISARAMKGAVALLEPLLIGSGHRPDKVAVLGTIKGDLHDIGKNLVAMMLKGANFQIVRPGHQHQRRRVPRCRSRAQRRHHRLQRPADHDHGQHAQRRAGRGRGRRHARPAGHHRRRPGHARVRHRDRRERLGAGRGIGGARGHGRGRDRPWSSRPGGSHPPRDARGGELDNGVDQMKLQFITCDMLMLPVEHLAAASAHEIVISDLSASLHVEPLPLRDRIQEEIDRVEADDPDADAILLGYGLCGGATAGLVARTKPLVLPRAHDCATIFLGSRERYELEHRTTPGTYWFTEDNVKRGDALKGWLLGDSSRSDDVNATYQEYIEKYGQENADYLMEALGEWQSHYQRGAFLETGLATDTTSRDQARQESELRGWRFELVLSDLTLIERLLSGEWDDDFIVVQPGERLAMSYNEGVVKAIPAEGAG